MKYSLGFTAGALLRKEAEEYIGAILSFEDFFSKSENVSAVHITTNSESSKKRIKSELDKRLFSLNEDYLNFFKKNRGNDQNIILLLAICKTYPIIIEFLLEVIYSKWKRFDYDISTYDFTYFLSEKLTSEQLDGISDNTKYKLSQVAIKMLKEIGMLEKEKINQIFPSDDLNNLLQKNNDGWFLNCLLINH